MHHHQAESGMKGKERGVKGTGVARRHGVTETTKLVGNDKKKKVTIIIKLIGFCIYHHSLMLYRLKMNKKRFSLFSHQVIGLLPGKDNQAPYVTCAAKVIPFCLSQSEAWHNSFIHSYCASRHLQYSTCRLPPSSFLSYHEFLFRLSCQSSQLFLLLPFSFLHCVPLICSLAEIQSWQRSMGKKKSRTHVWYSLDQRCQTKSLWARRGLPKGPVSPTGWFYKVCKNCESMISIFALFTIFRIISWDISVFIWLSLLYHTDIK